MRFANALVALTLLLPFASGARAAPLALEDGVAVLDFDAESLDGITAWTVNGVTHLRTQSLWVRVGEDGPEVPLAALVPSVPALNDTNASGSVDTLALVFSDPLSRFELELQLALSGTPFGPITSPSGSQLSTQITLRNLGASPIGVTLFQFTDVDLFGSFADDVLSVTAGADATLARITDSTGLGEYLAESSPAASAFEAGLFDATLASLLDSSASVLSGATGAEGDVTLALAWSALLAEGEALGVNQIQRIDVVAIPEPGVAWLLLGGLAILAVSRRTAYREGET